MKWLSRNIVEDFWRDVFGSQETYRDILVMVCKHLKISVKPSMKPQDLEAKISQQVMTTVWDKMTAAQRLAFEAEMKKWLKRVVRPRSGLPREAWLLCSQPAIWPDFRPISSRLPALLH